jgi:hypothetical protein
VIAKIFRPASVFLERWKEEMTRFFEIISKWSNWTKFYVMKVIGKIHLGIFLIGSIVNFHVHPILEFSDSRFARYWRFKNNGFLGNFTNFTSKSKVEISKVGPNCSLRLQQLWKHSKEFLRRPHYIKSNRKKFWQTQPPNSLNPTIGWFKIWNFLFDQKALVKKLIPGTSNKISQNLKKVGPVLWFVPFQ